MNGAQEEIFWFWQSSPYPWLLIPSCSLCQPMCWLLPLTSSAFGYRNLIGPWISISWWHSDCELAVSSDILIWPKWALTPSQAVWDPVYSASATLPEYRYPPTRKWPQEQLVPSHEASSLCWPQGLSPVTIQPFLPCGIIFLSVWVFLSCSMTLLFISLLPCNSGGLDLGLSCFFMWLLCFLVGWRSWPECQCPRIRYCTFPGEVESEMPCFPTLTPSPEHSARSPSCLHSQISLGKKRGSSLLELPTNTWTPNH